MLKLVIFVEMYFQIKIYVCHRFSIQYEFLHILQMSNWKKTPLKRRNNNIHTDRKLLKTILLAQIGKVLCS